MKLFFYLLLVATALPAVAGTVYVDRPFPLGNPCMVAWGSKGLVINAALVRDFEFVKDYKPPWEEETPALLAHFIDGNKSVMVGSYNDVLAAKETLLKTIDDKCASKK